MRHLGRACFALTAASLALLGCDDATPRENVREWRASDHAQPAQPDPERQAQTTAEEPSPEVIAQAAGALYLSRCGSCHGAEGDGQGSAAPTSEMPDFTVGAYHEEHSDADIARAIRMGSGLMPAFGNQLNERGITALVGHIRTFRPDE